MITAIVLLRELGLSVYKFAEAHYNNLTPEQKVRYTWAAACFAPPLPGPVQALLLLAYHQMVLPYYGTPQLPTYDEGNSTRVVEPRPARGPTPPSPGYCHAQWMMRDERDHQDNHLPWMLLGMLFFASMTFALLVMAFVVFFVTSSLKARFWCPPMEVAETVTENVEHASPLPAEAVAETSPSPLPAPSVVALPLPAPSVVVGETTELVQSTQRLIEWSRAVRQGGGSS